MNPYTSEADRPRTEAVARNDWANLAADMGDDLRAAGKHAKAAAAYRRAADHARTGADLRDLAATLPGGRGEDRDHAGWLRGDASAYDLLALEAEAQAAGGAA
jgi:hypothetical protein